MEYKAGADNGEGRTVGTESAVSTDLVRVYLGEIGKYSLLDAAEEVELAKKIEAGLYAGKLLAAWERQDGDGSDAYTASYSETDMPDGNEPPAQEEKAIEEALLGHIKEAASVTGFRRDLQQLACEGDEARRRFIESNLRLVVSMAKKPRYQSRGLTMLELVQEGNAGLIRAVQKFDYKRGNKFSTHAEWWIRQAIGIALEDFRPLAISRRDASRVDKLYRIKKKLEDDQIELTPENLAAEMDLPVPVIQMLEELSQSMAYLDKGVGEEDGAVFGEFIDLSEDAQFQPETAALMQAKFEGIDEMLEELTRLEQNIVSQAYGLRGGNPMTVRSIALKYGMRIGAVEGLLRGALGKMRTMAKERGFDVFLEDAG